ncbi:hypothetical protein [Nocardia mangyaensis]|nr:hypothetical protein [Nocardia mangyaensis]
MRQATDADYLAELAQWSGCQGATEGVPARNTPLAHSPEELPVRVRRT